VTETFDYIIVGAGSAGCVVANRLSENKNVTVLLLEAGPNPDSPWMRLPAGLSKLMHSRRYNWLDMTEPAPTLNQRQLQWTHGRTLGGSSAINGLVYSRGAPHDYDDWAAQGNTGWRWTDIRPYFEAIEKRRDHGNQSSAGELGVSDIAIADHAGIHAFLGAGTVCGLPLDESPDRSRHCCIGRVLTTTLDGRRHSSADAFLQPVRHRKNLHVRVDAPARRVLFTGKRATGVEFGSVGDCRQVFCRREVILCGGATNSPQLLMLSGIGPAAQLRAHGIDVLADRVGVGANLQDHMLLNCSVPVSPALSLNRDLRGLNAACNGIRWLLTRRGPIGVGAAQAAAFVRSNASLCFPDLQINFNPFTIVANDRGNIGIDSQPGIALATAHLHPVSRGSIALQSAQPEQAPVIRFDPLSAPEDLSAHLAGMRWMQKLLQSDTLAPHILGAPAFSDDETARENYVRNHLTTMAHPVGTCRMGGDDNAVVDAKLRVYGVENLRVIDGSVMPTITSGNTNGPCIVIGARGADLVHGKV